MEFVLVVKRRDFVAELALPQGYAPLDASRAAALRALIATRGFFVERRHAELDPELKQPIPYCVVHDGHAVLCVRRSKRSSEGRLHGAWSVGIGGHIEPQDHLTTSQESSEAHNLARSSHAALASSHQVHDVVARAARRELHEELLLSLPSEARLVGWLNDDANPVGAVHLGLVHLLRVECAAEVAIRETERLEGGFVPHDALTALRVNGTPTNAPTAPLAGAAESISPRGERRSFPSPHSLEASCDGPVPRAWDSLESWSRLVLEALRPSDLAALSA
jgi:predicted NUDIX family phosphoesterase